MQTRTEIRQTRWTGDRIARLGFLLGLGWDARRIAEDPLINSTPNNVHRQAIRFGLAFRAAAAALAVRLPPEAAQLYDAAAAKRRLSRDAMIKLLLLVVAADPHLLENILDDGLLIMELDEKINALEAPYSPDRQPLPTRWEPEQVARALVKAFATLDRLPHSRGPREPGGHWPRHSVEWADQLAQAEIDEGERRDREDAINRTNLRPTSLEIAQMEAAFDWPRELRAIDTGMALVTSLWALRAARGRSVKALCRDKKWAPHTFYRKRAKALTHLAEWLNARGVLVF